MGIFHPGHNGGFAWNTGLPINSSDYFLVLQGDGNICSYQGTPSSHSQAGNCLMTNSGNGDYFMVIQDDGNLVLYSGTGPADNRGPIWSKQTGKVDGVKADSLDKVLIGSMDFAPCSKMEWKQVYNATLRTAPQRLFAYATINKNKLKNDKKSLEICAQEAVASCAVSQLILPQGACYPAFSATLSECLKSKNVDSNLAKYVNISTESKCMW